MGRPSKLTPQQWEQIDERLLRGDTPANIAKDFRGATRQMIEQRGKKKIDGIKDVAKQIVSTERNLHRLPPHQQLQAQTLAQRWMRISDNLTEGADRLAGNFFRLSVMASTQLDKVDEIDPEESDRYLKSARRMTQMAAESAEPALRMMAVMKASVTDGNGSDVVTIAGGMPD